MTLNKSYQQLIMQLIFLFDVGSLVLTGLRIDCGTNRIGQQD